MARRDFSWVSPGRWPSLLVAIVVLIAMFLLSGIILVISVRLLGGLEAHHDAWRAAWPWLLAWRLSLYAALVLVWWRKVRPRAVARLCQDHDDGRQALAKLRRLELMALGILVLLEVTNLVNQLGVA